MGLFLNQQYNHISNINANYVNTNYTNTYGNYSFGDMLFQSIPSIFMYGGQWLSKLEESVEEDADKDIEEKTNKLNKVLSEASNGQETAISDLSGLQTTVTELTKSTNTLKTTIDGLKQQVNGENSSASIGAKLQEYYDINPNTGACTIKSGVDENNIPADIKALTSKYSSAIETEKQIKEKSSQYQTKINELTRLTALQGQAENLQDQIDKIKTKKDAEGNKFNVKEESNDIKTFMTALKEF